MGKAIFLQRDSEAGEECSYRVYDPGRGGFPGIFRPIMFVHLSTGQMNKKTVAFPFQVSYNGLASEDVPLARIKVCILRKSTRVSRQVPGFMSGTFFMGPVHFPGCEHRTRSWLNGRRNS